MRRTAPVALLLAVAVAAGCSSDGDPDPGAAKPQEPAATGTPSGPAELPEDDDGAPDPDDPELDLALSEPVEDSYYPQVGDPGVDSLHYDLELAWSPQSRTLEGRTTLALRATSDSDHLQLDLSHALEVDSVRLDGTEVPFEHTGKDLVVRAPVVADERYSLEVAYAGTPEPTPAPTTRSDFSTTGWTTTATGETWTMQKPFDAFTYYPVNDQPADKALYDIAITVPSPWVGVANGELVEQTEADGLTTSRWHLSSPAASYLVTVATGPYTRASNTSASGVEISYWVPSDRPELAQGLMAAADGLDWLEERLGRYPFDTLGFLLVDSLSGMETQTMITLGATDYTMSAAVLVHELAHQWYGDLVTPEDWRDLWMNEGMAMYLQGVWQAEDEGRSVEDVMADFAQVEEGLRAESGPPGAYDPAQFGESNVYYGPALMWHALHQRIGEAEFWRVVRAWPQHAPMANADREEYLGWLVGQTGVERAFFDEWLLSPTTPASPASSALS